MRRFWRIGVCEVAVGGWGGLEAPPYVGHNDLAAVAVRMAAVGTDSWLEAKALLRFEVDVQCWSSGCVQ